MDKILLTTKLHVPPACQTLVPRPRLTTALSRALTSGLTLVSAPAGYGKTTLVSSWLNETKVPATWISLDEGENDPIRFMQYLITALQKISPAIQLDWLVSAQGVQSPPLDALLNLITSELARQAASFVIVLDDFHTIQAQPVLDGIAALLEHAPPQLHLVILSRTDPPLSLSRLRARSQLVEIRAEQLRFTNAETAEFLNKVMGLSLSAGDIAGMEARTEGWVAGLQLAALSMQGSKDIHSFVSAFTGSHYYIMDYLTEEVLKLQPDRLRSFLLQTSILTSMCASLCEAVVEMDGTESFDGQVALEALEQRNLFIVPLDDRRQWYRYHHLFADMLNRRLERLYPQQLLELHSRASLWYEQYAIIPEAIQHALLAKDQARAAHLVEEHGCSLLMSGEGFTLLKWVEAVQAYSPGHPWLAILKAWAFALTGQTEQVEPTLQAAEKLFSPHQPTFEVKIMLGSIATVRAFLANLKGESHLAADFAQAALEDLPDSNAFSCSLRSVATSILGDASWLKGDLGAARQAYLETVWISQSAGNVFMTMIANANLAEVLAEQGELHQAARIFSETLQVATRPDGQLLPLADRLYEGLGKISYEWSHLDDAAWYLHQCIELCRQWGNSNVLAKGYMRLARLEQARGNPEEAREAVRAAEQLASEQRLTPRQSSWVEYAAARWWIARGNPEMAAYLVQQPGVTIDDNIKDVDIPDHQAPKHLLLLRLLLAQGDHDAALALSERLLQKAESARRMGQVIEVLALQALAWQGKKDLDRAMTVLERALTLARPEGYARVFLDEGEPMAKLLYHARSHRTGSGYASELLAALGGAARTELPSAQLLIEPLTSRELEVLKLIEAGYTNQEIAGRLVISIPTVKRHISNIYAKLGAKSRTQAVSLGRELRLFE